MSETPEDRPRPTPRPRPGTAARPSPRPRVAGSRRDRDDAEPGTRAAPGPRPRPGGRPVRPAAGHSAGEGASGPSAKKASGKVGATPAARTGARRTATSSARRSARAVEQAPGRRRGRGLALTLAVLCLLTLGGGGFLLWQRLHPPYVTASVFAATRAAVQHLYAYDYKDSKGSVQRKLAVLTGDLRDQYKKDLSQGGIIDTYEQVSATTSYEISDVGLQQINDAQDAATLVVFGRYVVKSVNSGDQSPPQGSECEITPEGAQACTQTVQVHVVRVGGEWKVSELTLLTTS